MRYLYFGVWKGHFKLRHLLLCVLGSIHGMSSVVYQKPARVGENRMSTISEKIAAFADALTYKEIPKDVVEKIKLHLLDTLGISFVSSQMEFGAVVHKTAKELGKGDESTVIGFGTKFPAFSAALVNGTLGHGIDFDDTHIGAVVHVSAAICAAGLAVAEARKATGVGLIESLAVGMETAIGLGLIAEAGFNLRGIHQTGMCTPFGACLVAGKLLKLSGEALENSLGVCGTMASGITQIEKSWLKRMNPGWAAHSGIIAAYLGKNGFVGPRQVFEGVHGLFHSYLGSERTFKWSHVTEALGSKWEILNIAIKPYPACHYTHAFVDCARYLRETHAIDTKDIAKIECKASEGIVDVVLEPKKDKVQPLNPYMAQFSVQFLVAAMLVKGRVNLDTVYFEPLNDPEILELAEKIEWTIDPDSDYPANFPGEVRIVLKDGREFTRREAFNRGGPRNPLPKEEIVDKFMDNACRVIPLTKAKHIVSFIDQLERAKDVSELAKLYK